MHREVSIAVVPVAGLGTRLLPATKSQPKEMLPVARKPVVQYVVEELVANGVRQVLLVTGRGKSSIENHFDFDHDLTRHLRETGKEDLLPELEYERLRLQFFFTRQRRQKGLGDAVLHARHFTGERPFAVALGDSILGLHASSRVLERCIAAYRDTGASCVIAVEEVPAAAVSQYGIVDPGGDGAVFPIVDLVEKPGCDEAPSRLAIAARYVLSPSIYDALEETPPGKGGEIQLTDAIRRLLRRGEKIVGVRLGAGERRYDIGNFESYFEAFFDFALSDPQLGEGLTARLRERLREDR
jgi:UTP--glucose-1-phosphate uridylyltransferase